MCDTIRNNIKQLITNKQKKNKKNLGSAPKNRDGWVTGSKAFFLGLISCKEMYVYSMYIQSIRT